MRQKIGWRGIVVFIIAFASIAIDQFTKYLVRMSLPEYTPWNPISWLSSIVTLTHVHNTGMAFGLFQNGSLVLIIVASAVVVAILVSYRQVASSSWVLRAAFGLLLGGACGNLIDRLARGYVTDFIDFHVWPVFNVADMSIVGGALLLAYYGLFLDREPEKKSAPVENSQTDTEQAG